MYDFCNVNKIDCKWTKDGWYEVCQVANIPVHSIDLEKNDGGQVDSNITVDSIYLEMNDWGQVDSNITVHSIDLEMPDGGQVDSNLNLVISDLEIKVDHGKIENEDALVVKYV